MTNAERIRAMSDEEMAEEFDAYICNIVEVCDTWSNCTECKINWLRQEADHE